MTGIVFGESPRWRDGRLWFSDWGTGRVLSVAADGTSAIEAEVDSFPMCIDFLPDGRLLIVSSADREVLRREPRLYVVGQDWGGPDAVGGATGKLVSFAVPAPGAGYP